MASRISTPIERRSNRLRRIQDDAEDAEVIICPARADLMRDTALKEARQFSEGSAGRQEGLGCANGCVEEGAQGATRRCRESTSPWSLLVRGQKAKGKEPAPWAVKGFEHMIAYTDVRPQRQPLELSIRGSHRSWFVASWAFIVRAVVAL